MQPLTPLSYHILLALADEDRHGYAILKEVVRQSQRTIEPGTGALYTSILRLVDEDLIEVATRRIGAGDDPRRRYYRLTPAGKRALQHETARLADLLMVAKKKNVKPRLAPLGAEGRL
jgi:DNA-binding PadR family transcriptional regulator